jgi:hypothetical protein
MPLQHGAAKGVDVVSENAHAASATNSSDSKPGVGDSTGLQLLTAKELGVVMPVFQALQSGYCIKLRIYASLSNTMTGGCTPGFTHPA